MVILVYIEKICVSGSTMPFGNETRECIDEQTRVVKGDFMNREEKSLAVRPRHVSRYNILREFIGCENWDAFHPFDLIGVTGVAL